MNGIKNVTATFGQYSLTVTRSGNTGSGSGTVTSTPSGISCGSDCSETYAGGTKVTLSITPSWPDGVTWSGACSGTTGAGQPATCTVTMDANKTVGVHVGAPLLVTVQGSGTVTSADGKINCPGDCGETYAGGTTVTLTATPAPGQAFVGWSGACSGTSPACTVSMSGIKNVTATFTPQ
jgi:uncharacterized repeat protein (TIGR02543 family)